MAEPFNIEKFRQQMRGQTPDVPQPVPVQMQGTPVNGVMPPPMPQSFQPGQVPPQMPPQPQYTPQQMVPPIPPSHSVQAQPHAQNYNPPIGGQPQAWVPQGQSMPAPQMMPPPGFAPPPAVMAPAEDEVTSLKKPRFSLKRIKKEKAPKINRVKKEKIAEEHTTKTSPAMIFMFGLTCGIVSFLVGSMVMSNVFADKSSRNIQDIQARNASVQQPVLPTASTDASTELSVKVEE